MANGRVARRPPLAERASRPHFGRAQHENVPSQRRHRRTGRLCAGPVGMGVGHLGPRPGDGHRAECRPGLHAGLGQPAAEQAADSGSLAPAAESSNHSSSGSSHEDCTSSKVLNIFRSWMIAIRDHINGGFYRRVHHFGKQNA